MLQCQFGTIRICGGAVDAVEVCKYFTVLYLLDVYSCTTLPAGEEQTCISTCRYIQRVGCLKNITRKRKIIKYILITTEIGVIKLFHLELSLCQTFLINQSEEWLYIERGQPKFIYEDKIQAFMYFRSHPFSPRRIDHFLVAFFW